MSDEPTEENWASIMAASAEQAEHYALVIGAFKNDPMLAAMMANIHERRQETNADDSIV